MERIDKEEQSGSQSDANRTKGGGRRFFAVMLILVGGYWLLNRMGVLSFPHWLFQWPVILIIIGFVSLIVNRFQSIGGYVILLIGAYFYVDRNFDIPFDAAYYFWPLVLIVFGVVLLVRPSRREKFDRWRKEVNDDRTTMMDTKESTDASNFMDETVVMGGIKKDFTSQAFKGGRLRCFMGGAEIYLGDCKMDGPAEIQINGFMSGVNLVVPKNWNVRINTSNFMSGIRDERRSMPQDPTAAPVLVINGSVFMSGVELKST
ncbi:MAG: DUF5668 domain-containing protein [Cryomorphaceae bacterium]